jgi:hypothetical protein
MFFLIIETLPLDSSFQCKGEGVLRFFLPFFLSSSVVHMYYIQKLSSNMLMNVDAFFLTPPMSCTCRWYCAQLFLVKTVTHKQQPKSPSFLQ